MEKDNEQENRNCIVHTYSVGDQVLIPCDQGGEVLGKPTHPTHGPYCIIQVFPNGTVFLDCGWFTNRINICQLLPFHQTVHLEVASCHELACQPIKLACSPISYQTRQEKYKKNMCN
jgi:hypothetical protein